MSTPAPAVPTPLRTETFTPEMDAYLQWMALDQIERNAIIGQLAAIAAGTAVSLTYTFSTTTTDADPGAGTLRLDNATQSSATTVRMDLLDSAATDWTAMIDSFTTSNAAIKGTLRVVKAGDPTKWLQFNMTAAASPSGYRNLTVTNTGASTASPFSNGDNIIVLFTRSSSAGPSGTVLRHVTSVTSSATPTPNYSIDDVFALTALATAPTFGAPVGVVGATAPNDGQGLIIRIKDNGTPRALAYNTIYRASTDLALPSTTVANKTLYLGFTYNAADSKWDLIAVLGNI